MCPCMSDGNVEVPLKVLRHALEEMGCHRVDLGLHHRDNAFHLGQCYVNLLITDEADCSMAVAYHNRQYLVKHHMS